LIDFDGQVVVVTGAGRGLGRLYALDFAARGASVIVNDLGGAAQGGGADPTVADSVVSEIKEAGGVAVASHDSVASPEGGTAIVATALRNFGRVDALVSNAGITQETPFDELAVEQWRQMLSVHLDGGFFVSQPAFREMKRQGGGRIVFIASSAGLFGQPQQAHYAAAKAGILGLTNVVALEGAAHGIKANAVLPFGFSRLAADMMAERDVVLSPKQRAFVEAIDMELVVAMVAYLASPACDVTHQNYSACAGRFARVFVGLAEGWMAERGTMPTAEDVAEHLAKIDAIEPFSIPGSMSDEMAEVSARLGTTS
jgi:NAD(P)-dependent dehydrogenase (short-subunit alcohol dehydrogenase family)